MSRQNGHKKNRLNKRYIWIIAFAALLLSFTVFIVLDTFVIRRVYTVETERNADPMVTLGVPENISSETESVSLYDTPEDADISTAQDANAEAYESGSDEQQSQATELVISATEYSDANLSITLSEYREYDTTIYVADVELSSPELLNSAFAEGLFGKNITQKTSVMAEENGAILAINGDYYGSQEKGYVIRNGILYRDVSAGREDLVIYNGGTFEIINENDITADELLENGAWQVLSFGPAIVEDGAISVGEDDEVGKAMASNPRTAIAMIDDLHYLFIVSDGRTDESEGLSLYELAEFITSLGAQTAYNLDGGGSSSMYFNRQIINQPTTNGNKISERSVSDILYIGY